MTQVPVKGSQLRLLQLTSLTSALDRAAIAPIILIIARDLGRTVDEVTLVATVYFLAYGVMQLVWAITSDRFGRVRTMRLALILASGAGLASAFAPSLMTLLVLRALTGAAFAAAVPAALVYIGDMVPMRQRHGVLADLATGTAVGLALGTVGAAVLAERLGWRVAFAATAIAAALLAVLIGRLPEPPAVVRQPLLSRLPQLARNRSAIAVLSLAWLEGFTVLGFLVFMPVVLQIEGASASASGLVVAFYGVAVVVTAAFVKRVSAHRSPAAIVASGGTLIITAFSLAAIGRSQASVFVACALLGAAWALMHTSLQAWATNVAPEARAVVISVFATMLFLGNAAGTFVGGVVLTSAGATVLFLLPAVAAVPLTVAATVGRARHPG